jgi:hypothetical protein
VKNVVVVPTIVATDRANKLLPTLPLPRERHETVVSESQDVVKQDVAAKLTVGL